jgi:predicted transcriptional regulator
MTVSERPVRSAGYQWVILEEAWSNDFLSNFSNTESIYGHLNNGFIYTEEYLLLQDQLVIELWRIAEAVCTERQLIVMKYHCQGYTQMEIAKMLNVNQSSITKCLNGNVDYKHGQKVYGGLKKKLKKHIEKDEVIQSLLKRMDELLENIY